MHVLLAFRQALEALESEGGVAARATRYRRNHETLMRGMSALGFEAYLSREHQGPIITAFRMPEQPRFVFREFYDQLNRRGLVIYPGKVSSAPCFRIGTIGNLWPRDLEHLVTAIGEVLAEMGVDLEPRRGVAGIGRS